MPRFDSMACRGGEGRGGGAIGGEGASARTGQPARVPKSMANRNAPIRRLKTLKRFSVALRGLMPLPRLIFSTTWNDVTYWTSERDSR